MQELIPSSLWALLILRTFLKEKSSNGSTMQHQFNTTSKGCQRRGYDISNLDKYRQMLQSRGTLYYSMRTAESMRACLTGICMDSAEEYFLRGLGTSENGIKAKCTEGVSMWAKVVGGTSGSGRMTSTMAKVGPLTLRVWSTTVAGSKKELWRTACSMAKQGDSNYMVS